ncbi:glycoside hydrolase family 2 TIM barrel-domain containing protein [Streptomyces sp. bgisy091]|uniref:glycoside hydrolase family 2 TIM barrel-domain containing protein n=1 Tax=Streptomyces sp. bgisy091 TaxID=3413778 RepID=UPI003D731097
MTDTHRNTAPAPRDGDPADSTAYWTDLTPGTGRLAPRAHFPRGGRQLTLDGTWSFRLSPTADAPLDFLTPGGPAADDPAWVPLTVPGHWVLQGHDVPRYTNTAYPFPIDPPNVPDANPTGDHHRCFQLPDDWPAPGDAGTVLRFDGVDSCFKVWLNGIELGTSKGSRLPAEFDAGPALRTGRNDLAVRVHRWSSGSYLEDQDMWWLPGIFRDVTLLEVPPGSIGDHFVHASYDHEQGSGTLRIECDVPALVTLPALGVHDHPADLPLHLPDVEPWSAELPRLYNAELAPLSGARPVPLRIGFRTVAVRDGRFTVNGVPVLLRGVNRHEHDPDKGRAIGLDTMRQDLLLMKRHNINAVRTAHYPPHPAFLDLCDELGMWVVDECDLETHGFIHSDWAGNPADDPRWLPMIRDRMRRTVERDKNHPSVVIWSLGNESHHGTNLGAIADWTRERDPSRPLHYERDRTYRHSDFYSLMYAPVDEVDRIGRYEEEPPPETAGSPATEARRRGLPFLLCEFAHAMGNGPGSLTDYQRSLEAHPRCAGAFVWEWIDHGLRRTDENGDTYFAYGGDFGDSPHGGTFCIDGLLFPDRTPSPGLAAYKKAIEPVAIDIDPVTGRVGLRNRHDVRDLSHLRFRWVLERDGTPVAEGELKAPPVAARTVGELPFPELPEPGPPSAAEPAGHEDATGTESWLTVRAVLAADEPWAPAGHEVAWAQARVGMSPPRPPATGAGRTPVAATFDERSGLLRDLDGLELAGPFLDVWRAPTDNDRGMGDNSVLRHWREAGLDRLVPRTESVERRPHELLVRSRWAPDGLPHGLRVHHTWAMEGDALRLAVDVIPEGPWDGLTLPRVGLRFTLPAHHTRVSWYGKGPGEAYPDSAQAARVGLFTSDVAALQTPYVVPQENGRRADVRRAELVDPETGLGLRVSAARPDGLFGLTVRPWSAEQLEAAAHPHELVPGDRLHLHLDAAQHGLGSASCGPAPLDRHQLRPRSWRMEFLLHPVTAGDQP